jgi:hypothetical protein
VGSDQRTLGDERAPPRALIEPSRAVLGETQQLAARVARARGNLRGTRLLRIGSPLSRNELYFEPSRQKTIDLIITSECAPPS